MKNAATRRSAIKNATPLVSKPIFVFMLFIEEPPLMQEIVSA